MSELENNDKESKKITKITENEFEEFKELQDLIINTNRKIGEIEYSKFQVLKELDEIIKKFREYQLFLYKKYELDPLKSYTINEETREFILKS